MFGMRMQKSVDLDRARLVAEYVTNSNDYTLLSYLNEHKLLEGSMVQGENTLITCPLHIDYSPSMSINTKKSMYKCFSCGENGGYFKFILTYMKQVESRTINYYALLEEFLQNDSNMQLVLGFRTIYRSNNLEDIVNIKRARFNSKTISKIPENYIELANIIKRDKEKGMHEYILMISLMQKDVSVKDIYKELYVVKDSIEEEVDLDISKLIQ